MNEKALAEYLANYLDKQFDINYDLDADMIMNGLKDFELAFDIAKIQFMMNGFGENA